MIKLKKDTTEADWKKVLGETARQYDAPIEKRLDELRASGIEWPDEDDLTRDHFLSLAYKGDTIVPEGIVEYYRSDWYSRCIAKGLPDVDLLTNLIKAGEDQIHGNAALLHVVEETADAVVSPKIFEQGFGRGYVSLGMLSMCPGSSLTMMDIGNGYHRLLQHCVKKYMRQYDISFVFYGDEFPKGPFDLVCSNEVMEHCLDPVAEINRLASIMRPGGLLYLSTFFNDINGKNPSHLKHNNIYQDTGLWFATVESAGFESYGYDQNGVLKTFRRL